MLVHPKVLPDFLLAKLFCGLLCGLLAAFWPKSLRKVDVFLENQENREKPADRWRLQKTLQATSTRDLRNGTRGQKKSDNSAGPAALTLELVRT